MLRRVKIFTVKEEVKSMIDETGVNLEDRIIDWHNDGINILEIVSKYIREDIFTTSKEAYQIGVYLGKLESWKQDINNIVDRLNELIAAFNAS